MTQPTTFFGGGRGPALLTYALLFFMPMTLGATGIVALLVATFTDSDKTPDWVRSHLRFQIRTFWIGCVPTLLTFFATQYLIRVHQIEPVYLFLVVIPVLGWVAARCAMGFNHLLHGRPYPDPATWLV